MALAKKSIVAEESAAVAAAAEGTPSDDDPLGDWEELTPVVATGSQSDALPTTSRTTTVTDPLTTQLLAEVARRTATMEFDPAPLVAERDLQRDRPTQEIDPAKLVEAMRDAEKTPAVEPAHPNTKRREK